MVPKPKRGSRNLRSARNPLPRPPVPHDVLVLIAERLSAKRDLLAFSLVARSFRDAAEPFLYRELVFPYEEIVFGPSCVAFVSLLRNLGDGRRFTHTRSIAAPWQAPPQSMEDLVPLCSNLVSLSLSAPVQELEDLGPLLALSAPTLVGFEVELRALHASRIGNLAVIFEDYGPSDEDYNIWHKVCGAPTLTEKAGKEVQTFSYTPRRRAY
ncbi:hypothetical protein DFJ74DRAFT_676224 [Hyaloraphidium curvatum]|nr:hypothetical protein DFJ74DRAFT_676224 [Hyaloraphidium curvatum]